MKGLGLRVLIQRGVKGSGLESKCCVRACLFIVVTRRNSEKRNEKIYHSLVRKRLRKLLYCGIHNLLGFRAKSSGFAVCKVGIAGRSGRLPGEGRAGPCRVRRLC